MIYVAIGANLGHGTKSPIQTCKWATGQLNTIEGLKLVGVAPWYLSEAMPPSGQPSYTNGVAAVSGVIAPQALLAALHRLETQAGRRRSITNAARTLDLDIIDMDGLQREGPDPILPHPRAHLRAFVLYPLQDLAPDWRHPRSGAAIRDLISALPPQIVHRL